MAELGTVYDYLNGKDYASLHHNEPFLVKEIE